MLKNATDCLVFVQQKKAGQDLPGFEIELIWLTLTARSSFSSGKSGEGEHLLLTSPLLGFHRGK